MTIDTLNQIKADTLDMITANQLLADMITSAEGEGTVIPSDVDLAFTDIALSLNTIKLWVEQAIMDGGAEEPVVSIMRSFLDELKVVFDKYKASITVMDGAGYGQSYGGADFIRITVEDADGVVETKDFVQNSLSSDALVTD